MADDNDKNSFGLFASWRVIAGLVIVVAGLWVAASVIDFFTGSPEKPSRYQEVVEQSPVYKKTDGFLTKWFGGKDEKKEQPEVGKAEEPEKDVKTVKKVAQEPAQPQPKKSVQEIAPEKQQQPFMTEQQPRVVMVRETGKYTNQATLGTAFVTALIEPIAYELNERSLGWRPNDIVLTWFTDNVEMTQRGVLDVVRRTSENLVEHMAKTGSAIQFDKNLHNARSMFNYDPESFMFPSAEAAYKDAINELKTYRERLNANSATFYARADRLIPLLKAYEELLGSCNNNLVKTHEPNGDQVSFFDADDYYFYAQGVAKAMGTVLQAVLVDFTAVLETRGAINDLNYAIQQLHKARDLSPVIILNSDLDGLFANHRANLAAYVSYARAYIQYVIKTMST